MTRWLIAWGTAVSALLVVALPLHAAGTDPRDAGLPWYWLAFGFAAQGAFFARFLVQWIASERAGASVVPRAFWILSLVGGVMLLAYFLRRGDPVGVTGQAVGLFVYVRNLMLLTRGRGEEARAESERTVRSEG